jgi:hypothetical protein
MATFVLTSAASAAGLSGLAGTALGLGAAVVGSVIDRRLFGAGGATRHRTEEGPRLSGFHITASTEGAPINRLWGRSRLGGQMIWATRFKETAKTTTSSTTSSTSGGKGGGGQSATTTTTTTTYQYACSFAIAFCEGEAAALGRVWADGKELELSRFTYRFHRGTETQAPDAFIETIEGAGNVPAYRGICYLVFEEMPLEAFGNRIPQITAEIIKPIITDDVEGLISAVTLIPASGEFVYATSIHVKTDNSQDAFGENMHNAAGEADFTVSLDQLGAICPNVGSVLLVVAWFGDDLRAASCTIRPKVEVASKTVTPADWRVNGVVRSGALTRSVLAGGNTLAIGNEDGGWEIIQYVTAELIGVRRYRLARLLRGQLGTESEMRDPVAAGARVVLIDANALQSLDLTADQRLLDLTYRYGPAAYGHDHFTYAEATLAFRGVGLRPLSPARVKAVRPVAGSDIALSWIRRGRVAADSWEQTEVALGEESEAYDVEIMDGGAVIRTFATTAPAVTYTAAEQTADWGAPIAAPASLSLRIYQKSVTFGRGVALGRTLSFPLAVET